MSCQPLWRVFASPQETVRALEAYRACLNRPISACLKFSLISSTIDFTSSSTQDSLTCLLTLTNITYHLFQLISDPSDGRTNRKPSNRAPGCNAAQGNAITLYLPQALDSQRASDERMTRTRLRDQTSPHEQNCDERGLRFS